MKIKEEVEIYIHIPFCVKKCSYCDFLSFKTDEETIKEYVNALIREIDAFASNDYVVTSIFIGGGTPSIIEAKYIDKILKHIRDDFSVKRDAEITIECNPGTVTLDKVKMYEKSGINRVSMGLQSADNKALKKLGRIHTWEKFLESYGYVREAGIKNINIDLMSGLPEQSVENYVKSLKAVCDLKPEHISAYSLIIEEGTPFYELYNDENGVKRFELPDEDRERMEYSETGRILEEAGYKQYEISNYAKSGYECKHNIGYWTRIPYYGFGLGASSLISEKRYHNTYDMNKYLSFSGTKKILEDEQYLTMENQMEEFMFLGLRMINGINKKKFSKLFKKDIMEIYGDVIEKYKSTGFIRECGDNIRLTKEGIDVSNVIFADFLF